VGVVSWALWGLFVGLFARLVRPGRHPIGCWWTIALGVAGSLVGGFVATGLLDIADADEFDFGSFLIAVIASAILLAIWERVERALPDRDRDPRAGGEF
jgi:uncharacterized membrane protein YeaQ/YmgE (transglycosylase-associated protein family)